MPEQVPLLFQQEGDATISWFGRVIGVWDFLILKEDGVGKVYRIQQTLTKC